MIRINGIVFGNENFRNGEAIYRIPVLSDKENVITLFYENNKDIGDLVIANSYISYHVPNQNKILIMPYLPYSRMDREITDQIFTLKYFADFLNGMNFHKIFVADPHSKVSSELIKNLEEIDIQSLIISEVIPQIDIDFIMFPDKGARDKYTNKYPELSQTYKIIYGQKKRDLANNGKIIEYNIIADGFDLKDKAVLIIDDISSFGSTFIHASTALKENGIKKVYLFVTHAEETILKGNLLDSDYVVKVFTTNSVLRSLSHPNLVVFDIF